MRSPAVLPVLLLLLCDASARADDHRVVVAPSVRFLRLVADHPPTWIRKGLVTGEGFHGSVLFSRPLLDDEIGALEGLGMRFSRISGGTTPASGKELGADLPDFIGCGSSQDGGGTDSLQPGAEPAGPPPESPASAVDRIDTIYPAFITWAALDALAASPLAVQIESDYVVPPNQPLNVTRQLTGAPQTADYIWGKLGKLPGDGIRIADIDSGIDVFHPAFFRPDGGYHRWLDVDGNGELTLGTDAVDLDGDGKASALETLRFFDVTLVNLYDNPKSMKELKETLVGDGKFEVDLDWLYADTNGNGSRDFGPEGGFTDADPAFGEPILAVDDVNRNGRLDLNEKLVLLKSSKIRKAFVAGKDFVAGENLSTLTWDKFPADPDGVPTSMHGTGVAGILAANTPGLQRFVGMAPYADLYMIDSSKDGAFGLSGVDGTIPKLVWARNQKVHIVLFEFSSWGITFMDGTSNLEKAIDKLYIQDSIAQVVPAGNLAESGKHVQTTLPQGDSILGIEFPPMYPGYTDYPFWTPMYIVSFYWKGETTDVEVSVALPGSGKFVKLPANGSQEVDLTTDMMAASMVEKSLAGYVHRMTYVWDEKQMKVMNGTWQWKLSNKTGKPLPIHGFALDAVSSWERSLKFDKWESSESTICHPGTADLALTVAAYGGEFGPPEELGDIRPYSSRGPRMDGFAVIDIAAPDDPYTPLARLKTGMLMGNLDINAGYTIFGGTSGAGPHVAGTMALMKQIKPGFSPKDLFDAVVNSAVEEPIMGNLPNKEWGHGKLNVYKALFGALPSANQPPVPAVKVGGKMGLYITLDPSESYDPENFPLECRYDFDYDGVWDTSWLSPSPLEYGYPQEGDYTAKVAVRDGAYATSFALVSFHAAETYPPDTGAQQDISAPSEEVDGGSGGFTVEDGSGGGRGGGGCTAGPRIPAPVSPWLCFLLLAWGSAVLVRRWSREENR
ncbi:MAG: hypothetical protein FJ109_16505 [Deltaproteobacteria bacterium]|nr:hypothetical protein [Deltaproteobacteria bacterium]